MSAQCQHGFIRYECWKCDREKRKGEINGLQDKDLLLSLAKVRDAAFWLCRYLREDAIVMDAIRGNEELPTALNRVESAIKKANVPLDAALAVKEKP